MHIYSYGQFRETLNPNCHHHYLFFCFLFLVVACQALKPQWQSYISEPPRKEKKHILWTSRKPPKTFYGFHFPHGFLMFLATPWTNFHCRQALTKWLTNKNWVIPTVRPTVDEGPGSNFLGTNLKQIESLSWTVPWSLAWFLILQVRRSPFITVFWSQPIDFPSKTGAI